MPDNGEQTPRTSADVHLTYAELGRRLGISTDAARVMTRRRGWPRVRANSPGAPTIVVLPEEELAGEQWRQERTTLDLPEQQVDDRVDRAEQRADLAEQLADAANKRVDAALALATDAIARADRSEAAITGERQRADVLRDRLDTLRADLDAAQREARAAKEATQTALQAAATLRRADEARRARGLLGRLRAALRGE